MRKSVLAVLATGAVVLGLAGGAWAVTSPSGPSPPPGIHSINSHPIGTVGSETEGVGGMWALCQLPPAHRPPAGATLAQVEALCAQYGTGTTPGSGG